MLSPANDVRINYVLTTAPRLDGKRRFLDGVNVQIQSSQGETSLKQTYTGRNL